MAAWRYKQKSVRGALPRAQRTFRRPWVLSMFLLWLKVSRVSVFVRTDEIVHFKHMPFTAGQLRLNKAGEKVTAYILQYPF